MSEVIMPRLSDSMEEGTIIRWLKADGEPVTRGEELVEIETDKATMAYESDFSGTLAIVAPEGTTVTVGTVIGLVGDPQELAKARRPAAATARAASGPTEPIAVASPPSNGHAGGVRPAAGASVKASPLARRVARGLEVELSGITGSGPYGRILKADVVQAARARPAVDLPPPLPALVEAGGGDRVQALSRVQSVIARRMAESRRTVPDFALGVDVDMSAVLEMRAQLKAFADPAPSLNDFIVKACGVALGRHPRANGSFGDARFLLHPRVNVAIAVAAEESLIAPVVTDVDTRTLGSVAAETRRLIQRVKEGALTPADLDGGTFTVSNLGMFGIDRFEGIINAPQSAILCVGAVADRPVAIEGELAIRSIASMTLAADHRILYGADAAAFLVDVRRLLEHPLAMI